MTVLVVIVWVLPLHFTCALVPIADVGKTNRIFCSERGSWKWKGQWSHGDERTRGRNSCDATVRSCHRRDGYVVYAPPMKNANSSTLIIPLCRPPFPSSCRLKGTDWGELDVLILDMPPGTGDVQLAVCQDLQLSGAVAVTTPSKLAEVDTRRGMEMFTSLGVPTLAVVENLSYFEVC